MEQQPQPHHQEKPAGDHVLKTPVWVMVIRGFQILVSIIILGLCASLMHDAYLAEEGFSLAVVCEKAPILFPSLGPSFSNNDGLRRLSLPGLVLPTSSSLRRSPRFTPPTTSSPSSPLTVC